MAGLVASILLIRRQIPVIVIERKSYPFHRVCGEYISNETRPFLQRENLFPAQFSPANICQLQLTSVNGKSALISLGVGGFGISRFAFDNFLFERARSEGVQFMLNTEVTSVNFREDHFTVDAAGSKLPADIVLGTFGKRSKMDHAMNRRFVARRSPYAGVKYHIETNFPVDRIALHNFSGGYCGISRVEGGVSNLCYLTHRDNLKKFKSISAMEEAVLFQNPYLRHIFNSSRFLLPKPEVINEISFDTKVPVEQHMLMAGDAAGMITPLCGNGMAMAIHSADVASTWISGFMKGTLDRTAMEDGYARQWRRLFARRLWVGRKVQSLFGGATASNLAVGIAQRSPTMTRWLVEATHGAEF
jgi:flavin-dependent dehydrogenase